MTIVASTPRVFKPLYKKSIIYNNQYPNNINIKAETEGFIFAAQDQSLVTKNFQANII